MSNSASAAGGAAGAGGHRYAARVAAYFAVSMLGERAVVLGWETSAGLIINSVACETTEQVDDIRIALSDGSAVLIQAKRRVTAQTTGTSALGSAHEPRWFVAVSTLASLRALASLDIDRAHDAVTRLHERTLAGGAPRWAIKSTSTELLASYVIDNAAAGQAEIERLEALVATDPAGARHIFFA